MKMVINGEKRDSQDGRTIDVFNSSTGQKIASVPDATKQDVQEAIAVAQKGKQIWGYTPLSERCAVLKKFQGATLKRADEIAEIESRETGRPFARCQNDITGAGNTFTRFAEAVLHKYSNVLPRSEKGFESDLIYTTHEPLGVVSCIVPFNHPMSLYCNKVAPALAAGNAVIIKPPSDDPLVCIVFTEILLECGVPKEALQVVTGRGSTVGNWVVDDPGIDAVSFTGSTEVGRRINELAAKHFHRVSLEMGGNDALIIAEDADLDAAVAAAQMRLVHAGQICNGPKRVLVHKSVQSAFLEKLLARVDEIAQHTDLMDPQMMMSYLINEKAAKTVEGQVELTIKQGAKKAYGKERNGTFMYPVVLTGVTRDMDIAKDMEVFGPVIPIIEFETIDEAIDIANASVYGLMAGVISRNYKTGFKAARRLQSGGVVFGGAGLYRTDEMPFGGYKSSGIGREGIACALHEMSQIKTTVIKGVY